MKLDVIKTVDCHVKSELRNAQRFFLVSSKQRAQVNMYLVDKVMQFLWRGSIFGPVEVYKCSTFCWLQRDYSQGEQKRNRIEKFCCSSLDRGQSWAWGDIKLIACPLKVARIPSTIIANSHHCPLVSTSWYLIFGSHKNTVRKHPLECCGCLPYIY